MTEYEAMIREPVSFRDEVYPYGNGPPRAYSRLRVSPEDFLVDEVLGFEPTGDGEHLLLRVRKRDRNSDEVVRWLSQRLGVARRNVGYCGMKDRHAITSQWFSLPSATDLRLPKGESDGIEIIDSGRHARKLRRGKHAGNRFVITLRELSAPAAAVIERFGAIVESAVPNYFGPQRFGRGGQNVARGLAMLSGQERPKQAHLRGLLLSALRSFLFNEILAERVTGGTWNRVVDGDATTTSMSIAQNLSAVVSVERKLTPGNPAQHPTGMLFGPGDSGVTADAAAIEARVLARYPEICNALAAGGPDADRRPLAATLFDAGFEALGDDVLRVSFALNRGEFATSVLRELVNDADAEVPWVHRP